MSNQINGVGLLLRWFFAVILVFGTYNPTQYCYSAWVFGSNFELTPIAALTGVTLLIGWIIYLRATVLSLGLLGVALFAAFFACLVWVLVDAQLLSLDNSGAMTWVTLLILTLVLALGMSWSLIRRRLTGQVSVDDVED